MTCRSARVRVLAAPFEGRAASGQFGYPWAITLPIACSLSWSKSGPLEQGGNLGERPETGSAVNALAFREDWGTTVGLAARLVHVLQEIATRNEARSGGRVSTR
jgi:hypothetical protein